MIKSIDQLKLIDGQIAQLKKIIKQRSFVVGFTINYGFGGNDPENETKDDPASVRRMQFGMSSGIEEELPKLMLKGLENQRESWLNWANKDLKEIQDYLENVK